MNSSNQPRSEVPPIAPRNFLASDVVITGTLKFGEELTFDGMLEGEIFSKGSLIIGKSAMIEGKVKTRDVTLFGTVTGNITAADRCELKAESSLTGDLTAVRILVEDGATFVGRSEVGQPPKPETSKTPATGQASKR